MEIFLFLRILTPTTVPLLFNGTFKDVSFIYCRLKIIFNSLFFLLGCLSVLILPTIILLSFTNTPVFIIPFLFKYLVLLLLEFGSLLVNFS